MKTSNFKLLAVAAAIAALGMGSVTAQAGVGGNITNTRHNLGVGGVGVSVNGSNVRNGSTNTNLGDIFTTGTDQICVFCHTPHGAAQTDASGVSMAPPAPLWNKTAKQGTSYKGYTMGGNMATETGQLTVGGMSLACLTCHDGTQAMDNMMNAPGRGGWTVDASNPVIGRAQAGDGAGTFTDGAKQATGEYAWYNADGLTYGVDVGNGTGNTRGSLQAAPAMLGTDLSNDHPISMVYGGGITASGATPKNAEFRPAVAVSYNSVAGARFAVDDTGSPTPGTDTNSTTWGDNATFKLYSTDGTIQNAQVQCGTCHDPHIDANPLFLRKSNSGSSVCLSCHIK